MEYFLREKYGRYYIFERALLPRECVIAELPLILQRNIMYDIGVSSTGDQVAFYITYSLYPESKTAIWKIFDESSVNKSARAIKIINNSNKKESICLRVAF